MNTFQDNYFDFTLGSDLVLHYCGRRINSINHKYGPHFNNIYILSYICDGEAQLLTPCGAFELRAGQLYVLFPASGATYTTAPNMNWSIQWIVAEGSQMTKIMSLADLTPEHPVMTPRDPNRIRMLYKELFNNTMKADPSSKLMCVSLLYELFSVLAAEEPHPVANTYVSAAMELISRHYAEGITVGNIADRLSLNCNYLSKLIKSELDVTPIKIINHIRYDNAMRLLRHTDLTITEVARTVGLADALYFSRSFKRYTGFSPSEYRRIMHT